MRINTYVVEHDYGFAPNPFHGVCSLACCKPVIRKHAHIGDLIIGTGSANVGLTGVLVYWMKVEEIITFDEYWQKHEFRAKRPNLNGSRMLCFGDNIYHSRATGAGFIQAPSFHSDADGNNLDRDTGLTDRVLLSRDFAYWGKDGPTIPDCLKAFVKKGAGHKNTFTDEEKSNFLKWLSTKTQRGWLGEPAHWGSLKG